MTATIRQFQRRHTAALQFPPDDIDATPATRLIRCAQTLEAMIEAGEFDDARFDTRAIVGQLPMILRDISGQVR